MRASRKSSSSGSWPSTPCQNGTSLKKPRMALVPVMISCARVVLAEAPLAHLGLEEADGPVEERLEHGAEVDAEVALAVEGLALHDPHELGVGAEEVERGGDDVVGLAPPLEVGHRDRGLDPADPLGQRRLEHLPVDGLLVGEVVQEAGLADAHAGGDVVERGAGEALLGEAVLRLQQDRVPGRQPAVRLGHASEGTGMGRL